MYKMLVSDFDGTLLDRDEAIPLSTMVEIDRIRKNGCLLTIATGRVLSSVLDYNRDFPFIDYIISCNGAYIYDVNRSKVLYKKSIMPSMIKKIKKMYGDNAIYFCTSKGWNLLTKDRDKKEKLGDKEYFIDDFLEFYNANKENIYKIEIFFKNKKMRDNAFSEMEELKLKVNINKQTINKNQYAIEVTMLGIDKMLGVEKICKKEKISVSEVIAIGDGSNDISMIKNVGMGVAVSNASRELKSVAVMKTSSNDAKGVEKVIKKLL